MLENDVFINSFKMKLEEDNPTDFFNIFTNIIKSKVTDNESDNEELFSNEVGRLMAVLMLYGISDLVYVYTETEHLEYGNFFDTSNIRLRFRDVNDLNEMESELLRSIVDSGIINKLEYSDYVLYELKRYGFIQVLNGMYQDKYFVPLITPNDARLLLNQIAESDSRKKLRFPHRKGFFNVIPPILSIILTFKVEVLDLAKYQGVRVNKYDVEPINELMRCQESRLRESERGHIEIPLVLATLLHSAIAHYCDSKNSVGDDEFIILRYAMAQTDNFKDWAKIDWAENYYSFIEYLDNAVQTGYWAVDKSKYDKYSGLCKLLPSKDVNDDFFTYQKSAKKLYAYYNNRIRKYGRFSQGELIQFIEEHFPNLSQIHKSGLIYGQEALEAYKKALTRSKE